MTKLNWEYQDHSRRPEYRAEYNGLILRAVHDESPENPFENWDGEWPMMVQTSSYGPHHDVTRYEKDGDIPLDEPLKRFSDAQLVHDQKAIAAVLGCDPNTYCEERTAERKWHTDVDFLREAFSQNLANEHRESDIFGLCAKLYEVLGITALSTTSRGYSQGDWANLLIAAVPEAKKKFGVHGNTKIDLKQLESQAKLYGAWAWGDVYGYVIAKPELDEDGEVIGAIDLDDMEASCWGYYGSEFDESGLEEQAISSADYILATARKRKQQTVKELVRNRVPLWARPALVEAAGEIV
jgi:hypothetical protein